MINPNSVNPKELNCLALEKAIKLPSISALYFCISRENILYIGITDNLNERWKQHHKILHLIKYQYVNIHWLPLATEELNFRVEKEFIEYFKPLLNGRIHDEEEEKSFEKFELPPFVKLYLDDLGILYDLPASAIKLLCELIKKMDWENVITLSVRKKREIADNLNTTIATFDNNLAKLVNAGILKRIARSEYRTNPNLICRGTWFQVEKHRKDWELIITYSYDGLTKSIQGRPKKVKQEEL